MNIHNMILPLLNQQHMFCPKLMDITEKNNHKCTYCFILHLDCGNGRCYFILPKKYILNDFRIEIFWC